MRNTPKTLAVIAAMLATLMLAACNDDDDGDEDEDEDEGMASISLVVSR